MHDFSELGYFSGHVLSKTKSVTPNFFFAFLAIVNHYLSETIEPELPNFAENLGTVNIDYVIESTTYGFLFTSCNKVLQRVNKNPYKALYMW